MSREYFVAGHHEKPRKQTQPDPSAIGGWMTFRELIETIEEYGGELGDEVHVEVAGLHYVVTGAEVDAETGQILLSVE